MKQIGLLLILPFVLVLSCGTTPEPQESEIPPDPPPPAVAWIEPLPPETPPEPVQTVQIEDPVEPAAVQPEENTFDPHSITMERFTNTKTEVQLLIADLNKIIRAKNYNGWIGYLADSYFDTINSGDFLEEKTEELYRRDQIVAQNTGKDPKRVQKRILKTARDYFTYVVVPSRSNDRMDDIEFVSESRVLAYTQDSLGNRLILYDLELIDNLWMIIN